MFKNKKEKSIMIKVKKSQFVNFYDFIYKNKIIAQIEKKDEKFKGLNDYNLLFWTGYGFEIQDAWLGYNEAKNVMINSLKKSIQKKEIVLSEHPNINTYYQDEQKKQKEHNV
tara:strand:+ start:126 stop:461 length:336 start_codon:yes stop_codon:yes gene_type:complete